MRELLVPITVTGDHSSVVAFNVLEHIPDDVEALRTFAGLVRPGGRIVMLCPAFPIGMSRFDREVGHVRRYTKATIGAAARDAGLQVEQVHYVGSIGLLAWIVNMRLLGGRPQAGRGAAPLGPLRDPGRPLGRGTRPAAVRSVGAARGHGACLVTESDTVEPTDEVTEHREQGEPTTSSRRPAPWSDSASPPGSPASPSWRSAIRLWTLTSVADFTPDGGDPFWYHQQANDLVDGRWFTDPFIHRATGEYVPGAQHPPLYTMWLSVSSLLGADSYTSHKVMSCLAGVLAVVLIGLAARAAAGARAGLIAAGLAAVYPPLWVIDGLLWPEGLFAAMIALSVLFAYRWRRSASLPDAIGLGVAIALATLTRGEAVGLLVVLVLPLMVLRPALTWRTPAHPPGGGRPGVRRARGAVVDPQLRVLRAVHAAVDQHRRDLRLRQQPVRLRHRRPRSTSARPTQSRYEGTPERHRRSTPTGSTYLGFWYFPWEVYQRCIGGEPPGDVSQKSEYWRKMGLEYAKDNLDRFPVVAAARVGRVWDVWRPFQNAFFLKTEGRNQTVSNIGVWCWWAVAALAIYGAVVLRRRGQTILPFVSLAVLITITAVYGYGTDRFRVPMDVAALILAGAAIDAVAAGPTIARSTTSTRDADARLTPPTGPGPPRARPVTFGTIARMPGPAPAPTEPGTTAPPTSSTWPGTTARRRSPLAGALGDGGDRRRGRRPDPRPDRGPRPADLVPDRRHRPGRAAHALPAERPAARRRRRAHRRRPGPAGQPSRAPHVLGDVADLLAARPVGLGVRGRHRRS